MGTDETQNGPSLLERVDLALASHLAAAAGNAEPLATAQRVLDRVRRPMPSDARFVASLLRLRGFFIDDDDAIDVAEGRTGRLTPITQEYRLLRGLLECLKLVRARATAGKVPDAWFLVELFRAMTAELPRFRNNDLRRGPPWDALIYVNYPPADQLRSLIDTFDVQHNFRDMAQIFRRLHPVRQGFRLLWRFVRIAPFPDFNTVIGWLGLNAWLLTKGYPLLHSAPGDHELLARLAGGPPPTKIVQFEARLLAAVDERL
ncbi:MAG TPA: hypothetical protein VFZ65_17865 [Planctomycetota bacterium]|nr:hypothetical protein [Planctomycetota bacterium]